MDHGTRSCYQLTGCRCTPCRSAEARYRLELRRRHVRGLPILGQLVAAEPAKRMLRVIRGEYFGKQNTIRAFQKGRVDRRIRWKRLIRLATFQRAEGFYQQTLGWD
jgi:hypothetical protein